jgi:putative transposase
VVKTFKYRLYPSVNQKRLLEQTLETCRRWYNTCLAERKEAWERDHRSIGHYEQLAKVKDFRKIDPLAGHVHSHILQVTTTDLDKAFQAFFRRMKASEKPGYPRFRGKGRFNSFGLKQLGDNAHI